MLREIAEDRVEFVPDYLFIAVSYPRAGPSPGVYVIGRDRGWGKEGPRGKHRA